MKHGDSTFTFDDSTALGIIIQVGDISEDGEIEIGLDYYASTKCPPKVLAHVLSMAIDMIKDGAMERAGNA